MTNIRPANPPPTTASTPRLETNHFQQKTNTRCTRALPQKSQRSSGPGLGLQLATNSERPPSQPTHFVPYNSNRTVHLFFFFLFSFLFLALLPSRPKSKSVLLDSSLALSLSLSLPFFACSLTSFLPSASRARQRQRHGFDSPRRVLGGMLFSSFFLSFFLSGRRAAMK